MHEIEERVAEVRLLVADGQHRGAAVIGVRGEIDLETAPLLRKALQPVLEDRAGAVVVDLSEVTFMDSTGVHVLVESAERLDRQNRRFAAVCCEGGPVHRVLALVGLVERIAVHRSRESAVIGGRDLVGREPGWTRWPFAARA
jgi:anti-sigma B factor antagonist